MTAKRRQFKAPEGVTVERVMFTLPVPLLDKLDRAADQRGYSRNLMLVELLEAALEDQQ